MSAAPGSATTSGTEGRHASARVCFATGLWLRRRRRRCQARGLCMETRPESNSVQWRTSRCRRGGRARGTGRQARPAETCSVPRLPADHRGAGGGEESMAESGPASARTSARRNSARIAMAPSSASTSAGRTGARIVEARPLLSPAPEEPVQGVRRLRPLPSPAPEEPVQGAHARSARPAAWRKKKAP
jgi:hypothetical protein